MKSIISFIAILTLTSTVFAEVAPEVLERHRAIMGVDNCQSEMEQYSESYDLGNDRKFVIIPCTMGAYQGSSRAYITGGSGTNTFVEQVSILAMEGKTLTATLDLMEASYDPEKKLLGTRSRGRGIGDCGQSSLSKIVISEYGSVSVKTIQINNKAKCDGKMTDWPTVFKQK